MQIYQSGWKGWKYMVRNRYMNIDKADKMVKIQKWWSNMDILQDENAWNLMKENEIDKRG